MAFIEQRINALEARLGALEARVAAAAAPLPPAHLPALPPAPPVAPSPLTDVLQRRAMPPRFTRLLDLAAEEFGTSVAATLSARRDREAAVARMAVMALALDRFHWTSTQVGLWLGRDHTTVLNGRERTRKHCGTDPEFGARLDRIAAAMERRDVA